MKATKSLAEALGLPQLLAELEAGLERTLTTEAETLANLQRQRVPVGKTGRLKASIRTEPVTKKGRIVAINVHAGGPLTTVAARAGQGTYDYARGVEFGTSDTKPAPFFWPSYRERRKPIKQALIASMKKTIEGK